MGRLSNLRIVDPVLTQLSIGYSNDEMVGGVLFPHVDIDKEAGHLPIFNKEAFFLYETERALRAQSNRMNPDGIDGEDIVLDEHDLEYPIDYREDAEAAFPVQAWATHVVTEGIQLRREKQAASLAQDPANYPVGNKIALSGTSQFTHEDSDPEGVIDDGRAAVRGKIAKEPNTAVIGYNSYRALRRNRALRATLSTSRTRLINLQDLREIFEIENIVIGRSVFSTTLGEFHDFWDDNIVLAYVPKGRANAQRTAYEPSFGYTFRRKGQPVIDRRPESGGKIELVRNTDIFRTYLLGAEAGYLISNTNA